MMKWGTTLNDVFDVRRLVCKQTDGITGLGVDYGHGNTTDGL